MGNRPRAVGLGATTAAGLELGGPVPPPWAPAPPPFTYWGFTAVPVWDPGFGQWGFWLYGLWIPLPGQ